ncbi:uncharacterized protein LY79DRAFT_207042 [Colletotrichum navitas]|uniref:Secreted protein n=1 Tax=Colletotrichum navitas TaxID=681940 RepID=A0AAD8QB35_9PEZI|nr:uncharacterized protein LY79DRAFT_207042 [Colletotrichum navitas]KAK1599065.1 hypothetical protein LY79DRAFT_207042 [Colletotrichum navitas]
MPHALLVLFLTTTGSAPGTVRGDISTVTATAKCIFSLSLSLSLASAFLARGFRTTSGPPSLGVSFYVPRRKHGEGSNSKCVETSPSNCKEKDRKVKKCNELLEPRVKRKYKPLSLLRPLIRRRKLHGVALSIIKT